MNKSYIARENGTEKRIETEPQKEKRMLSTPGKFLHPTSHTPIRLCSMYLRGRESRVFCSWYATTVAAKRIALSFLPLYIPHICGRIYRMDLQLMTLFVILIHIVYYTRNVPHQSQFEPSSVLFKILCIQTQSIFRHWTSNNRVK